MVGDALPDLIDRPPGDRLGLEGIRAQNALRGADDVVQRDRAVGDALFLGEFVHLHVDAQLVAALARDDEDVALLLGLDDAFFADIGKIGDREHVHHAPGLIGVVADELEAECVAHRTARAVGADDVTRPDGLDLPLARVVEAFDPHRRSVRADVHPDESAMVIGHESVGRSRHDVEEKLMHARLIDDHMRIGRQTVLDVLDEA